MKNRTDTGMVVVKCACGLPMRQKDWAAHWNVCYKGSSVPVTDDDIKNLEEEEAYRKKRDEEHQKWLDERMKRKI